MASKKTTSRKKRRKYAKAKTLKKGPYKSLLEVKFADELKRIKNVEITYETVRLPYTLRRYYLPDFVCRKASGGVFYIEVKGYFRGTDRVKLKAVREAHPEADVRLLFAANNKISSKSDMRYSDWCEKNGFTYAIKEIPKEWFE